MLKSAGNKVYVCVLREILIMFSHMAQVCFLLTALQTDVQSAHTHADLELGWSSNIQLVLYVNRIETATVQDI